MCLPSLRLSPERTRIYAYAKDVTLGVLLFLAMLQYYALDVITQIVALNRTVYFVPPQSAKLITSFLLGVSAM